MGISMVELSSLAEKDVRYENMMDSEIRKIAETEKDFVIDGRLGFYFAPNTFKIFLTVEDEVAANRIFDAKRETENFKSFEETLGDVTGRFSSVKKRYMKHYGIDFTDEKWFDLVLDTTKVSEEEVVNMVLERSGLK